MVTSHCCVELPHVLYRALAADFGPCLGGKASAGGQEIHGGSLSSHLVTKDLVTKKPYEAISTKQRLRWLVQSAVGPRGRAQAY